MDVVAVLDQAIALLHQRGRVTSRTFTWPWRVDDTVLDDLTVLRIQDQRLAADEEGAVLIWNGNAVSPPARAAPGSLASRLATTLPSLPAHILRTLVLQRRRAVEDNRGEERARYSTRVLPDSLPVSPLME